MTQLKGVRRLLHQTGYIVMVSQFYSLQNGIYLHDLLHGVSCEHSKTKITYGALESIEQYRNIR